MVSVLLGSPLLLVLPATGTGHRGTLTAACRHVGDNLVVGMRQPHKTQTQTPPANRTLNSPNADDEKRDPRSCQNRPDESQLRINILVRPEACSLPNNTHHPVEILQPQPEPLFSKSTDSGLQPQPTSRLRRIQSCKLDRRTLAGWWAKLATASSFGKVSLQTLLLVGSGDADDTPFRPGLERTDNGMRQTSWPDVQPINQKNYYT
jgi:hypothetical protein